MCTLYSVCLFKETSSMGGRVCNRKWKFISVLDDLVRLKSKNDLKMFQSCKMLNSLFYSSGIFYTFLTNC